MEKPTLQGKMLSKFIAQAERDKLKEKYSKAKFLAILSDGSTDRGVIEQEIVFCRFAIGGEICSHFVALQSVDRPDADSIYTSICSAAKTLFGDTWQNKIVSVCTDGASVMTGSKTGVTTKIQNGRDYIIPIHCMAHRLELSIKDTFKDLDIHKTLEKVLKYLYTFYHKSTVNRSGLKTPF